MSTRSSRGWLCGSRLAPGAPGGRRGTARAATTLYAKHCIDTRAEASSILARSGQSLRPAVAVESLDSLILPQPALAPRFLQAGAGGAPGRPRLGGAPCLVAVDEAQFFGSDLIRLAERVLCERDDTALFVSGLDLDFAGARFGAVLDLVEWAAEARQAWGLGVHVYKLRARCTRRHVAPTAARRPGGRIAGAGDGNGGGEQREGPHARLGSRYGALSAAGLHATGRSFAAGGAEAYLAPCGRAAALSQRLSTGGAARVRVGGAESYQPACIACHVASPVDADAWHARGLKAEAPVPVPVPALPVEHVAKGACHMGTPAALAVGRVSVGVGAGRATPTLADGLVFGVRGGTGCGVAVGALCEPGGAEGPRQARQCQ